MRSEQTNSIKVAVIGCGKLGLPCAEVMADLYSVAGYDIQPFHSTTVSRCDSIKDAVEGRDIIFVAVPTPHDPQYGGSTPTTGLPPRDFDYTIARQVLKEINRWINRDQLVVLISTVLPGTVRRHLAPLITRGRFIYNPYLIAMGSVKWDMVNPECVIIGTEDGDITGDAQILADFYRPLMANNPPHNIGTWEEAESIKIFYNTFISVKIGLVNMIQDVAERVGNMNVDVVTDALKRATHRITGPSYLTAGMGDGGACHPRDNIALRWMAQELDLGYDLFDAIMTSRERQASNMADRLIEISQQYDLPIAIHGIAYKPYVEYTIGSYSLLVSHYITQSGNSVVHIDPLTGDGINLDRPHVILAAHNPQVTYSGTGVGVGDAKFYCPIPDGSVILDPWRTLSSTEKYLVIPYGNTRASAK